MPDVRARGPGSWQEVRGRAAPVSHWGAHHRAVCSVRRPATTSHLKARAGPRRHRAGGVPLRRELLVVEVLDLFIASWRRQFPHRQWPVDHIVGATTVFPVVHVDHPQADSERSHWRLPRLLTSEPLTAYSTSPCPTAARSPPQARSVASHALPAPALCCPWCVGWPHCAHAQCACVFAAGQCPAVRVGPQHRRRAPSARRAGPSCACAGAAVVAPPLPVYTVVP